MQSVFLDQAEKQILALSSFAKIFLLEWLVLLVHGMYLFILYRPTTFLNHFIHNNHSN